MTKLRHPERLGLHIRVVLPGGVVIGPGRAELLDAIARTGSIAAASREASMSYKRAWDLVVAMNAEFREPLVHASPGGPAGGGARLTEAGQTVLATYRRITDGAGQAAGADIDRLEALARPDPDQRNGR